MKLRDYQRDIVEHACSTKDGVLYYGPTGVGKGVIERAILARIPDSIIITPSAEIMTGDRIWTPVKYRNRAMAGLDIPHTIIWDEAHHEVMSNVVASDLWALNPDARWIGFTATPYRATWRATQELRKAWPNQRPILTWDQAIQGGWIQIPEIQLVPLADDDKLVVANGEFTISSCNDITVSILRRLKALLDGRSDVILFPSTEICRTFADLASCNLVLADTPRADRDRAYEECQKGVPFCTVAVVSEGWDAPWLDRLIDARPTMSPVRWVQAFGRVTRPGKVRTYLCTNRNLERHGYLLEGCLPAQVMPQAQTMFKKPTTRTVFRLGLEVLGRLKRIPFRLLSGSEGSMYTVRRMEFEGDTEYVVLARPDQIEPLVATRKNRVAIDGTRTYGRWQRCDLPEDFQGYQTAPWTGSLSDKQLAWWRRSARAFGLDPEPPKVAREFQILPVLSDLKVRLR
jgi:hypothetical protein